MTAGFQVFNSDGSLQFDTSTRTFRPVMSFSTGTSNGSKTIANLTDAGTPEVFMLGKLNGGEPAITISGNTVSWAFDSSNGSNSSVLLFVMVH